MQLNGTLTEIFNEVQISDKFRKRGFVLETKSSEYPQLIPMEFQQDNCNKLNDCNVGDEVIVDFEIKGRKWIGPSGEVKYFSTLVGTKIENVSRGDYEEKQSQADADLSPDNEDNGLPF